MPRKKPSQQFEATSLEDILAGRTSNDAFSDFDDVSRFESLQPRVLQVREAERGFSPEFSDEHNEETRFRVLDGTTDDDPYWWYLFEFIKELRDARTRIRERKKNGLPPNPSDVSTVKKYQRGLNEALPNLFRHEPR